MKVEIAADGTFLVFCDPVRSLCVAFLGRLFLWLCGGHNSSVISDNTIVKTYVFQTAGHLSSPLPSLPFLS